MFARTKLPDRQLNELIGESVRGPRAGHSARALENVAGPSVRAGGMR